MAISELKIVGNSVYYNGVLVALIRSEGVSSTTHHEFIQYLQAGASPKIVETQFDKIVEALKAVDTAKVFELTNKIENLRSEINALEALL